MKFWMYAVLLAGILGCIRTVQGRCRRENYTDWFGRVSYDQSTDKSTEECFWNFIPPKNMSAALILKIVSFPILNGNNPSQNYIRLPGGTQVDQSNLSNNLHQCKRYVQPEDIDVCSKVLLDNYCSGRTVNSSQWPPRMMSFSNQTSGQNSWQLFYLGFTISYVFVPCPKPEEKITTTTTTTTIISTVIADTDSPEKNSTTEIAPQIDDLVKSSTMTSLVAAVGSIAMLLILGCGIVIIILLKKLRVAKSSSSHNLILSNFGESGTYAFATDNSVGTIASAHEYATLRTIRTRTTSTEATAIPSNGYLTMRVQNSKKASPCEEIKSSDVNAEPYLNESEENERVP